ncbi:hypothetical protein L1887_31605 [Cichorium endivia]|nr:hypothetical protein L1887_31605 [Cichorium endivia]
MENFLRSKEIWSLVEEGIPTPAIGNGAASEAQRKSVEDAKLKDLKVKNFLFQAIDKEILETILEKKYLQVNLGLHETKVPGFDKESNKLDTLTIDELHGGLLVHEQRMQGYLLEEHALKITYDEMPTRGRGGRGMARGSRGRGRGRQSFDKSIIECFNCHKLGHFRYECPDLENKANFVETNKGEELVLMAQMESQIELAQRKHEGIWYFDFGCSNHMTGDKEWFTELEEVCPRNVKLGNDMKVKVRAKGKIRIQVNGITQVISDVYFVPDLKNNLSSCGQFQERGLAVLFQHGACKIFHPTTGLIMQKRMKGNRMFYVVATMKPKESLCLQTKVTSDKEIHLWQSRFGHINHKGLRTLSCKNMVIGLPTLNTLDTICTTCLTGKQHREPIPKRVYGELQRYFSWCMPTSVVLSSQPPTATKVSVEKESGEQIVCLRTDCGGEFTSNEFSDFCKSEGIKRQLTAGYTPQQNGVAGRKNRTNMNAVRSVLNERQVPKVFWPEAVNCSNSPNNVVESISERFNPTDQENDDQETLVQGRDVRTRRQPVWMADYETGAGLSEVESEEDALNMMRGLILGLAAQQGWEVFQLDLKSAFLHGELKEEVFIQQPEGFIRKGEEDKVYNLKRRYMALNKHQGLGTILSKDEAGEEVDHTLFKQLVRSLLYLTTTTPDLMYGVSLISRFMARPKLSHWMAAKRLLRYLKGTTKFGVLYKRGVHNGNFVAYTDNNYAGDLDDGRSTYGYVFMMKSGAISWSSKKQPVVSLSTTEVEYIAAAFCACQCIWLRRILKQVGVEEKEGSVLYCDNTSTIQLSRNPVHHRKSKHIGVRHYDKPLKLEQFEKLCRKLGVIEAVEAS